MLHRALLLAAAAAISTLGAPAPSSGRGTARPHMDHKPRHGGIVLMAGDFHFEAVLDRAGKHRVYMSDEYRRPLPAKRFKGSITVLREAVAPERLPAVPRRHYLAAAGRPVVGAALARIEIDLGGQKPYFIDVPFPEPRRAEEKGAVATLRPAPSR